MKDINSSLGGGTYPAPDDTPGTIKGITVRNRGQYGRRVGIFTNEPDLVVGSKLHAGDYRHTPEEPEAIIDGYQAGKTVELSGMRTYHTIFSFKASAPFHLLSTKLKHKNSRMGSAIANGILTATAYDPATSVNDLNLGDFTLGRGFMARNHVSLTLNIAGTNHNFALDTNKHPALLTADLNYQLANVNHNLRAYVAIAKDGELSLEQSAIWTIHLAVPTSISVKVPRTNYNVELYNPVNADGSTGLGTFQGTHLNNALLKGLDVQRTTMTEYDMTPLADSQFATAPTVAQLVLGMKSWTNVYPDTPDWSIMHILLATDFKVLKQDTRYKIALVEISPSYVNGDLHQLISANYVKGGERTPAEFLIVGRDADDQTHGTRLIDVERSVAQNRLVGLGEEQVQVLNDSLQYLPEKGGVNGGGDTERIFASQLAIAVVAPANAFNHTTPLYRDTTESVTLELNFKRDHVDQPPIVLEDDEFGWSKEDDDRIGVILTLDSIPNTVIDKIVATHTTGTIEEIIPDVVESNGKWEIEFRDGFSQRDLTYSQSSGHIDFRLEMTRGAANNSAATKLNWTERKNYSVILPEVLGEIELESVPKFIVDPENNDQVVFNGLIKLPDDAPVGSRQPLYYCSTGNFSAKVNGLEAPVRGGIFVKPTNFGQDAVGAFTFTITKSELSEYGPGIHTLEVQADLDLLWNSSYQLVGQVQFQIIPLIEGTEDDVTFFTPEIFDANTEQAVNTNLRIVDLDTGEVLAESTSLQGLIDDAATRDLVDVSLIYGKPEGEAPTEILCEGAEEEVTLEMTGSFKLEVGGIDYGGPYTVEQLKAIGLTLDIEFTEKTPTGEDNYDITARAYTIPEALTYYAPEGYDSTPREDGFYHKLPLNGSGTGIRLNTIVLNAPVTIPADGTLTTVNALSTFPEVIRLNADSPFPEGGLAAIATTRQSDPWKRLSEIAVGLEPNIILYEANYEEDGVPKRDVVNAGTIQGWGAEEPPALYPPGFPTELFFTSKVTKYKETYYEADGVTKFAEYNYEVKESMINMMNAKDTLARNRIVVPNFLGNFNGRASLEIMTSPGSMADPNIWHSDLLAYYATNPPLPRTYYSATNIDAIINGVASSPGFGHENGSSIAGLYFDNADLIVDLHDAGEVMGKLTLVSPTSLADFTFPTIPGITSHVYTDEIPEIGLYSKTVMFYVKNTG